ncbi:DMT family transporter [Candidatus Dojkabacteria bacterium]|jgi:drug/metabolite transporter (DMT)-like permease|nr:DMT family transporter [Candidatus Dojkabacteria bacterium]
MNWLIVIIASVFITAFGSIFQRMFLVKSKCSALSFSLLFQLFMGISFFLINLFIIKQPFIVPTALIPNMILCVLLYSVGNIFIFKSLQITSASKFTIIFSSNALFSVIGFIFVLHQSVGLNLILGGILVLIGILLANKKGLKISFGKGEIFALLAGVAFGLVNVNNKVLLSGMGLYPMVAIAFFLEFVFSGIFFYKDVIKIPQLFKKDNVVVLLTFLILAVFQAITFFYALQTAPQSSAVVLINLASVLLTVILGIVILKEREGIFWKIIGAVVAIGGLVLLS